MTDKAISPSRRCMIEDMTVRWLAPKTQISYIRAVRDFTVFLGRSPAQGGRSPRGNLSAWFHTQIRNLLERGET